MATKRQMWAIFCATGIDVRHLDLSVEEASLVISNPNEWRERLLNMGGILKTGAKVKKDWNELFIRAHKAGNKAVENLIVQPMIVEQHENPLDDNSPVKQSWFVPDGVCGFAWVIIRPGNCSFANYMKKEHNCQKSYHGGVQYWISAFNQSYEKKMAYASAFAEVLKSEGINAYASGRLD